MKAKEGQDGIAWQWCCRKYTGAEAGIRLQSPGYYLLKEEGSDKVLAFRRAIDPEEYRLPEGYVKVVNPELLDMLDQQFLTRLGVN